MGTSTRVCSGELLISGFFILSLRLEPVKEDELPATIKACKSVVETLMAACCLCNALIAYKLRQT